MIQRLVGIPRSWFRRGHPSFVHIWDYDSSRKKTNAPHVWMGHTLMRSKTLFPAQPGHSSDGRKLHAESAVCLQKSNGATPSSCCAVDVLVKSPRYRAGYLARA